MAYDLLRSADDLTQYADQAVGKGAIDCETGRIAIWSVAQSPKPRLVGGLCPGESDPPKVAIVCARR